MFRILFIGDIIGHAGRTAIREALPELKEKYNPQFVIANGENLAGGNGLTQEVANEVFSCGVNFLTTGNHVWDKKEILSFIDSYNNIIRPANYPQGAPGRGYVTIDMDSPGLPLRLGIFNLSGRIFMESLDNPFVVADYIVTRLRERTRIIILDFHAEATSEKIAMGWHLDGRVSAVIGTHTHVQTADEIILPNHTAYITDVGMTGPVDSVIGVKKDLVIRKFLTQLPEKFDVAKGDVRLSAVIVDIDQITGNAISIERIQKIVKK